MNENDKSIDLARLQEAARKLGGPDGAAADNDKHQQAAIAAMRRRSAPAPVLRPDGSVQRPKPTMQEVERAKLRDAVMSEKAIGPTDKFNREAAQESDSYEAAQAAALAKLRGRAPGDDGHAPEGQAQGNEPER